MFWKYDDEEDKVVAREPEKHPTLEELRKLIPEEEMLDEAFPDYPISDETGSEERFEKRVEEFKKESKPVYKHHGWWFVHNCIAHPFIGILPCKASFDFHDWTSKKINGK